MTIDLDMLGTSAFLIDVSADGYRFADMNQARTSLSGRPVGEVIGRRAADILSAEVSEALAGRLARCVEDGRAIEFEETFGPPGSGRIWLTTLSPVFDADGRTIVQVLGIGADITERRRATLRAEQEAREAHARLRDAIEILPEAIVFLDADNRYVLWNRRYAELYPGTADLLAPGRALHRRAERQPGAPDHA